MMNQGTILIVEDTLESLRLLSDILGEEGYQVLPANSGELALASLAVKRPDLILLDLRMPGMDGFEVLRRLKAMDSGSGIPPVIILTAVTDSEQRLEGLKLGAVDFVSKPFQREELLARVKTLVQLSLARSRLEQQAADLQTHRIEVEMQNESLRAAQTAVEESRDRFVDFYEFAPAAYLTFSDKGLIADINQTGAALLGAERGKLLQEPFARFVSAADADRWHLHLTAVLTQDEKRDCELALKAGEGATLHVRLDSLRLVKTAQPVTVRCVLTDVTERKRAEARLETFFDLVPDLMCIATVGGSFLKVNPAWARMLGHTGEELISRPFIEFVHPEDREATMNAVSRQLAGEEILNFVNRYRCKDGSYRWLEWRTTPAIDGTLIYATARDITDRMRTEAALRDSEDRYRLLVETASEGILVAQGPCLKFVNPMVMEITGYTDAELISRPFLEFVHPDDRELMRTNYVKRLTGEALPQRYPIRILTKNSGKKWVEISGAKIDWEGQPATLNFVTDITERTAAEAEILRSNAELEQFSFAISHDMRQPLRMITSYMQLLETSLTGQIDAEKREYFGFAIDGAKRLDQMLLGLLEYSRVGRKGEPAAWIESRALLDDVLLILQPAIAEAEAAVRIEGDWPRVLVSPDEMLRLVQNLIANAVKFRVAGRRPEIVISSAVADNEWRMSVADNGVGIFPDQIDRLFHVFQRLQSRAAYEGTGIGLALCRKIAERHGGRIWAESPGAGQGSRFCVALPQPSDIIT